MRAVDSPGSSFSRVRSPEVGNSCQMLLVFIWSIYPFIFVFIGLWKYFFRCFILYSAVFLESFTVSSPLRILPPQKNYFLAYCRWGYRRRRLENWCVDCVSSNRGRNCSTSSAPCCKSVYSVLWSVCAHLDWGAKRPCPQRRYVGCCNESDCWLFIIDEVFFIIPFSFIVFLTR